MCVWRWIRDGNYASGTLALSSAKSAAPASGAASTPALIELGVAALAPTTGSGSTAAANWFKFLSTQLWFISITAILILLSVRRSASPPLPLL